MSRQSKAEAALGAEEPGWVQHLHGSDAPLQGHSETSQWAAW